MLTSTPKETTPGNEHKRDHANERLKDTPNDHTRRQPENDREDDQAANIRRLLLGDNLATERMLELGGSVAQSAIRAQLLGDETKTLIGQTQRVAAWLKGEFAPTYGAAPSAALLELQVNSTMRALHRRQCQRWCQCQRLIVWESSKTTEQIHAILMGSISGWDYTSFNAMLTSD